MFVLFTDRQLASLESLSAFNNWINPFSILGHSCVVCVLFWFSAALAPAKQSNHSPSPRARVLHDKRAADVSKTGVFRLPFKTCTKRVFFPIGVDSGIFAFFIRDYRDSDLPQLGRQWSCRFTESDCFCWSPSCHRSILQRFFQNLIPFTFWYAHLNNTNISQNVTVYRQHLWLRIPSKGNKRIHHRVYAKVICKNDWKFIVIILNIYIYIYLDFKRSCVLMKCIYPIEMILMVTTVRRRRTIPHAKVSRSVTNSDIQASRRL